MNRTRVAVIVVVLVGGAFLGIAGTDSEVDSTAPPSEQLVIVGPEENGSALWPYTSRGRTVEQRTLAINMIAMGDQATVEHHLRREADGNWTEQPSPGLDAENETEIVPGVDEETIPWRDAHGAARYTYVRPEKASTGMWIEESYQLYEGSYLGARYHIRAYGTPDAAGEWTAIQAHEEYWDWFRLRHTVTGTSETQRYIEKDLMDNPSIERIWRRYLGNEAIFNEGWATVIEFVTVTLLVVVGRRDRGRHAQAGTRGKRRRLRRLSDRIARPPRWLSPANTPARLADRGPEILRSGLLVAAILTVYLGVRLGGVAAEEAFQGVSPKVIVAVLYPVVAIGLPACAWLLSRKLAIENAFLAGVLGLGAAFLLDYAHLGVTSIPITVILHRVALILALGVLAAGSAHERARELVWLGVGGWVFALAFALAGGL